MFLEPPRSHQPFRGRVLWGAAKSFAGALSARAGQRAVQHRGGGEVERPVAVAQAASDLAVVEEPRSWPERVAVVSEPGQDLAGVREARFESLQRVDGCGSASIRIVATNVLNLTGSTAFETVRRTTVTPDGQRLVRVAGSPRKSPA